MKSIELTCLPAGGEAAAPQRPRRVTAGYSPTQNTLITNYRGLVVRIARALARRLPPHHDIGDLISVGTLGLLDAVSKYDPERSTSFGAFAEKRIRGAILDELRNQDLIPRLVRDNAKRIEKASQEFVVKNGRQPSASELGEILDLTVTEVEKTRQLASTTTVSLYRETDEGRSDDIAAERQDGAGGSFRGEQDSTLDRSLVRGLLAHYVSRLPGNLRGIVVMYYWEELSLKEISETLGVSESRVCQLHRTAIARLKARLKYPLQDYEDDVPIWTLSA